MSLPSLPLALRFKESSSFLNTSNFTEEVRQIIFFIRQGKTKEQMVASIQNNKEWCEDFPYKMVWENLSNNLDGYLNYLLEQKIIYPL